MSFAKDLGSSNSLLGEDTYNYSYNSLNGDANLQRGALPYDEPFARPLGSRTFRYPPQTDECCLINLLNTLLPAEKNLVIDMMKLVDPTMRIFMRDNMNTTDIKIYAKGEKIDSYCEMIDLLSNGLITLRLSLLRNDQRNVPDLSQPISDPNFYQEFSPRPQQNSITASKFEKKLSSLDMNASSYSKSRSNSIVNSQSKKESPLKFSSVTNNNTRKMSNSHISTRNNIISEKNNNQNEKNDKNNCITQQKEKVDISENTESLLNDQEKHIINIMNEKDNNNEEIEEDIIENKEEKEEVELGIEEEEEEEDSNNGYFERPLSLKGQRHIFLYKCRLVSLTNILNDNKCWDLHLSGLQEKWPCLLVYKASNRDDWMKAFRKIQKLDCHNFSRKRIIDIDIDEVDKYDEIIKQQTDKNACLALCVQSPSSPTNPSVAVCGIESYVDRVYAQFDTHEEEDAMNNNINMNEKQRAYSRGDSHFYQSSYAPASTDMINRYLSPLPMSSSFTTTPTTNTLFSKHNSMETLYNPPRVNSIPNVSSEQMFPSFNNYGDRSYSYGQFPTFNTIDRSQSHGYYREEEQDPFTPSIRPSYNSDLNMHSQSQFYPDLF
ncbi:hypothetical protein WA158_008495 [Blastocystis sp. Blastoise]